MELPSDTGIATFSRSGGNPVIGHQFRTVWPGSNLNKVENFMTNTTAVSQLSSLVILVIKITLKRFRKGFLVTLG